MKRFNFITNEMPLAIFILYLTLWFTFGNAIHVWFYHAMAYLLIASIVVKYTIKQQKMIRIILRKYFA